MLSARVEEGGGRRDDRREGQRDQGKRRGRGARTRLSDWLLFPFERQGNLVQSWPMHPIGGGGTELQSVNKGEGATSPASAPRGPVPRDPQRRRGGAKSGEAVCGPVRPVRASRQKRRNKDLSILAEDLPERRPVAPWVVPLRPPPLTACRVPFPSQSWPLALFLPVSPLPCPLSLPLPLSRSSLRAASLCGHLSPGAPRQPPAQPPGFVQKCSPASAWPDRRRLGAGAGAHSGDSCTGVLAAMRTCREVPATACGWVSHGQGRCHPRRVEVSVTAYGWVSQGLGRCRSRPREVSVTA